MMSKKNVHMLYDISQKIVFLEVCILYSRKKVGDMTTTKIKSEMCNSPYCSTITKK